MKRLIFVIFIIFLFSGCSANKINNAPKTETPVSIESSSETSKSISLSEAEIIPLALPNTTVKANFVKPNYLNYAILNTVYDKVSENYAVIYAVSNHNDKVMPWQTYHGYNSNINIQIFNKNGGFVKLISTELDPIIGTQSEPLSSNPCVFNDGMLSFFSRCKVLNYIFFDTKTETYTSVAAQSGVADGEYFVFSCMGNKANNFIYSLYQKNIFISSINVTVDDNNFNEGEEFEKGNFFTLDSTKKIAAVGNDKLTITLDFNNQTWELKRDYKKHHLEELVAVSPNGRWEIYIADSGGAGDAAWGDVVAVDRITGKTTYLTTSSDNSLVFGADNYLLVNQTIALELIDVEKAEIVNKKFAIDCEKQDCYINGITYDNENDWYLVTWRSPKDGYDDFKKKLPIILDIYDKNGALIKSMDTGFLTPPFYHNWVVQLTLVPDGKGSVTISDPQDNLGTVNYIN